MVLGLGGEDPAPLDDDGAVEGDEGEEGDEDADAVVRHAHVVPAPAEPGFPSLRLHGMGP